MLFRNRRVARVIACYLLLQTISSLAFPTVSLAMMGPSQPEFTSYEAPGATDLVNLVTGDFTYSLPVLDIPGPERSFSLPLTYKAGIQLEQEASWVGLGWSLNAGAIARSVNGYADDANNEPTQSTFTKKIDRGWNSSFAGIVNLGWNSITGHNGSVDLIGLASVGWNDDGINRGDVVGIGYTAGKGVSVDPVRMAMAVVTVATLGGGSAATIATNIGIQASTSAVLGLGLSAIGLGHLGGAAGYNNSPTRSVEEHYWGDNYWNFFNNNSTENAFGSLYFGKMSQNTVDTRQLTKWESHNYESPPPVRYGIGAAVASTAKLFKYSRTMNGDGNVFSETAGDIYQDATVRNKLLQYKTSARQNEPDPAGLDNLYNYEASSRPISIAHDYFSVMGEAISGTIRPYRLDVGSVAYPKPEANVFQEFNGGSNPTLVLPHYKHMAIPFLDAKVGFRYENSLSNGYDYHQYMPTGTDEATGFTLNSSRGDLVVTDPSLWSTRTKGARKGLYDGITPHMATGKQVTWYSNAEIQGFYTTTTNGNGNGFLEFEHPEATTLDNGNATNNKFRALAPPSGIGAFAVTGEDGTTYHYSLPVYQYQTYSESNEISTPVGELGKMTRRSGISSATNPSGGQATAWLLTAITSADYIDRNNSGTVDAEDWGGWVKFEYGKFSSRYKWRQPYLGKSYSDENSTMNSLSFTEGYKETYYLNAVSTRTHTALFIKSVRQDGRGHFRAGVTATSSPSSNLGIDERQPASSLRLDEIVLLDNVTLGKLRTPNGICTASNPLPVPALTNSTGSDLGSYTDDPMAGTGDDIGAVLDVHDLTANSRISKFLNANALKRIHFNYSYDLCRSTPNSFQCESGRPSFLPSMQELATDNLGGKLTLRSISFFGPTINEVPTKITPDFVFGYESASYDASSTNPAYGKEKWDAFGMYQPNGDMSLVSHKPVDYGYAAPWSLTTITSPLGGVTEIKYERDQYAHVSEYGTTKIHLSNKNCSPTFTFSYPNGRPGNGGNIPDIIKRGQLVYLTGTAKYNDCEPPDDPYYASSTATPANRFFQHAPFYVTSVSDTEITFQMSLTPEFRGLPNCQNGPTPIGADFDMAIPNNLPGGDIRVAAITTREGSNAYQVRYKYTVPNTENTPARWYNSTGVLAKEPAFLGRFDHPVNGVFDYPNTPVLYSQVSVLRGLFRNNNETDYETREEYSFYTPVSTMVQEVSPTWKNINLGQDGSGTSTIFSSLSASAQTTVDVGKIGQPAKVEIYNRQGERELSTDFMYAGTVRNADNIVGQGHYTEGLLNTERVGGVYRVQRSTKEYVPAVLTASRSTRNNLSISNSNVLYDFLTGQVLETAFTNSLGRILHTRNVPAYTLPGNEGMGTKGDNPANKHMLAQMGAAYTYIEVPDGPAYDPLNPLNPATSHILSANVQTWQNNWANYREPDASGIYQDVAGQQPVWRQAAAYTWQAPVLDTDGSYKNFTPFTWTGIPDKRWLKVAETVRYDHYSHALESRNVNGQYAAQKTGYGQTQLVASAANARYTEIAYSGAEDQLLTGGITQFGGEVVAGGLPVPVTAATPAHTGFYSLQLMNGEKGFLYHAQVGRDIDADKYYRLSVWANANAANGKLYVALNGTRLATSTLASSTTKKAGNWYLLSLLYKVPAAANGQTLEFGCANDGATAANFDDFRFAPLTATVTSKVYDPRTNNLLYSLDNDNLFTHYEYTPTGRLKRVYQETLDGTGSNPVAEKLLKEYEVNYARLLFPTWITTAYRCVTDDYGNYTGSEERQVTDINLLNQSAATVRWEANGSCTACLPPPAPNGLINSGIPCRLRNNQWEQSRRNGQPTRESCPMGFRWIFHWIYANGDKPADTVGDCYYAPY
jgi:hypothetical protein